MAELHDREPVTNWTTDFDHFDPAFIADPDAVWAELRQECPVAHTDRYNGMTVLSRWAEVSEAVHDTDRFTSRRVIINEVPTERRGLSLPPINLDPPDHTAPRRVMLPFFSPRGVTRWEETVRAICRRQIDTVAGQPECDLAVDYAQVIPAELTAIMLGVPIDEVPRFRTWLHDLLEVGPTDEVLLRATTETMLAYMRDLVAERRAGTGTGTGTRDDTSTSTSTSTRDDTDLVDFLLSQDIDGQPLGDDELARMLFLLLIAGIDTTWSGIGFSLLHLARHPEDRRRLAADPSLIPTAVEEFLRFYPPVWVARVATADTELGGCPIPAGAWVALGLPSINRDPEVFDQPDEFIIDRKVNRHAAFGLGVHRCLGSNLARMEMVVAVEEWLARYPDFELSDPDGVSVAAGQVRGPRRIPARILA